MDCFSINRWRTLAALLAFSCFFSSVYPSSLSPAEIRRLISDSLPKNLPVFRSKRSVASPPDRQIPKFVQLLRAEIDELRFKPADSTGHKAIERIFLPSALSVNPFGRNCFEILLPIPDDFPTSNVSRLTLAEIVLPVNLETFLNSQPSATLTVSSGRKSFNFSLQHDDIPNPLWNFLSEQRNFYGIDVTEIVREELAASEKQITFGICGEPTGDLGKLFSLDSSQHEEIVLLMLSGLERPVLKKSVRGLVKRQYGDHEFRGKIYKNPHDFLREPFLIPELRQKNWCTMYDLYIRFKDAGYKQIVDPEGIKINYCKGICPVPTNFANGINHTGHTHITSRLLANRGITLGDGAPKDDMTLPEINCHSIEYEPPISITMAFGRNRTLSILQMQKFSSATCGCY